MTTDELHHPDRGIDLEHGENVRDLGGYRTDDGNLVRWGGFVRSGDMDALSGDDQDRLLGRGIGTVIDLRMAWEIEAKPNVFADGERARYLNHDFWGDRFDTYRSANKTAPPAWKLADLYCAGLTQSGFVMADIMRTFADESDTGYLFHCRSGKDRTGLVAAMLLAIAGVPDATICADFALTGDYLESQAVNPIEPTAPGAWQRGCEAETMARTLGFIRENHGDVPGYLIALGVSAAELDRVREKLLG